MSGKIFVSYRRESDSGITGRLFDRLQNAFGSDQIFMDVENIAAGTDFHRMLEQKVSECDVLIAVIGPNWTDIRDSSGLRRLDNPKDFVRIEIEAALAGKKRIFPVLVNGASMPRPAELPEAMSTLPQWNAARLSHERFHADMTGLIDDLRGALKEISFEHARKILGERTGVGHLPPFWQSLHRIYQVLAILGLAAGVIAAVWRLLQSPTEPNLISGYERALTAITLGLFAAGAYGVFWRLIELAFGWHYGSGIGGLPKGLQAVALSLATTLPLLLLPPLFGILTGKQIVPPMHYPASAVMIVCAALGHILLYGTYTPEFRGLRNMLLPFGIDTANLSRAIAMEAVYAVVHFVSTVFAYQVALHIFNLNAAEMAAVLYRTAFSALVFFFGASTFVALCYPESIIDPRWVAIRGIVNGAVLMVALMLGILM